MSEQNEFKLPPLPSTEMVGSTNSYIIYAYTDRQMQSYARAAIAEHIASQSPAPIPEQVAQASSIEGLPAYRMGSHPVCFAPGVYYAASDVERLLATQSAKERSEIDELSTRISGLECYESAVAALASDMDRDGGVLISNIQRGDRFALLRHCRATLKSKLSAQASVEQATGAKEDIRNQALDDAAILMLSHGEPELAQLIRQMKSQRIDRASTAGAEGISDE